MLPWHEKASGNPGFISPTQGRIFALAGGDVSGTMNMEVGLCSRRSLERIRRKTAQIA